MTGNNRHSILFLSHGGGPLPLLGDGNHDEMLKVLRAIAGDIPKPKAILLISAHWEEPEASVTAQAQPGLLYDYYGFPEESYQIEYPAPGEPALAWSVLEALKTAGISGRADKERNFDHGMFIPLKIMYPEADIPCVQLSLLESLDAEAHIALGEVLSTVAYPGLMIIGSGFSFHNMEAPGHDPEISNEKNRLFEQWLLESCSSQELSEAERRTRLVHWKEAPHARYCHPREEHLLPLHVCYGAAQRASDEVFELTVFDKKVSMYLWRV